MTKEVKKKPKVYLNIIAYKVYNGSHFDHLGHSGVNR